MKFYKNLGFSLIELMVVVGILAVIASIAYPSYMESVRKSNRADAKATLNNVAQQMHRCYSRDFSYTDCAASNTTESDEGYYSIIVQVYNAGSEFGVIAEPAKNPQLGDSDCQVFRINNYGVKFAHPDPDELCW